MIYRRAVLSLVVSGMIALPILAADPPPEVTTEEQELFVGLMSESAELFYSLLAGVSDEQWAWKPSPDRWSVGECAEHIMRSNVALLDSAKRALASAANPNWYEQTKGKSELLIRVMPNRNPGGAGGASAPQEIRPDGSFDRRAIIDDFQDLYEELRALTEGSDLPLKAHTTEHPFPIFGTLNAWDWIIYVPLHTIRHSRQIIEVMETEGFPAN